jgi:hypothetical protein
MGEIIAFRGLSRPARRAPLSTEGSGDSFFSPALDPQPPEQTPAESNGTDLGAGVTERGLCWYVSGAVLALLLGA